MATRIKGITVEIGGDTTGLNKALAGTNKEIRNTQSQLKDVERLLKLDPSNTQLLQQKQRLLAEAVGETKTKLDTLKAAEKQVQQQFAAGKVSQEQYDGLQREIIETEERLKSLEKQANQSNVALSKIKSVSGEIADKAGNIATAMAPATLAITAAGAAAFSAASDIQDALGATEQIFGTQAQSMEKWADSLDSYYGIAKGEALTYANTMGAMLKNIGQLTEEEAAGQAQTLIELAGDLTAMFGGSTSDAVYALTGALKGNNTMLDNYGMAVNETLIKSKALEMGLISQGQEMDLASKQAATLALITEQASAAMGQAERESGNASGSLRSVQTEVKNLTTELGEMLLPVITPLIQKAVEAVKHINNLDEGQKRMIVTVLAVIAAISPVAGIISAVATGIGGLTTAISFLTANPLVRFVLGIVAVVTAITTLWNKSEAFRSFFSGMWQQLKEEVGRMKDNFVSVFTEEIPQALELLVQLAKTPVNAVINLINGIINGVNTLISGINRISFDIPDWVPDIGGKTLGFSIPSIPNIPMLATGGTVISGSAIVGEAGPELLTVSPMGTKVIPLTSGETPRTGPVVNFNATFYGYKHSDGMAAVRDLNRLLGRVL